MNWPSKYNAGIHCKWDIIAPLGHVILVEVTDFWIGDDPSNGCRKTSVTLNGKTFLGPLFTTAFSFANDLLLKLPLRIILKIN